MWPISILDIPVYIVSAKGRNSQGCPIAIQSISIADLCLLTYHNAKCLCCFARSFWMQSAAAHQAHVANVL